MKTMKREMLRMLMAVLLLACMAEVNAQGSKSVVSVKYCMTYDDFMDNRWIPIDSLTEGRTSRFCQMEFKDNEFKFKTGDKEADGILKKVAFAVLYDGHLYVNCRNLRCKDIPLDVSNYAQAYRYQDKKICVVAHWINAGAVLAGVVGDVVTVAAPLPVALPAAVGSEAIWWNMDKLNSYRCYLLESEANAKGKTPVTRITDEVMDEILANDASLLKSYHAVEKKKERQSASVILPLLKAKGLIKE